jgi:hypothetical protein
MPACFADAWFGACCLVSARTYFVQDLHAIIAHLSEVQDIVSTVLTTPVNISQRKSTYVPGIGSVEM